MTPPNLLFVSENLQLGGLVALALGRLHLTGHIHLAAIWSTKPGRVTPALGGVERSALLAARRVDFPVDHKELALFDAVLTMDYAMLAREIGVPFQAVARMNKPAVVAAIKALEIDLGVVCGHSQIFREALIQAPRRGWLNAHPSLLPMHRGPLPGFWELRAGEQASGLTVHEIDSSVDGGPILAQESFAIDVGTSFADLVKRQAELAAQVVERVLPEYLAGRITAQPQAAGGSHEGMPMPTDFVITPSMSTRAVAMFVMGLRGLSPVMVFHGALPLLADGIKTVERGGSERAGTSLLVARDRLRYRCADGWVELLVSPVGPGLDAATPSTDARGAGNSR